MTESAIITPQGVSASSQTIDNSYVPPDDRVLDPSTLKDSLLNRMPSPTGWRLLILPYRGKGLTSGGIALSKQTIDAILSISYNNEKVLNPSLWN